MARPRLGPGEKGNYNVSRKEKAKRSLKRKITRQTKEREKLQTKAKHRTSKKKEAEKALEVLEHGGLLKGE